jgi:hypothetical protein
MAFWYSFDTTSPKGVARMPESEVPDVYVDQMTLAQSQYGLAITFALSPSTPPAIAATAQGQPQVVVRMSLEHAKIMVMMLRKHLKQYELEHLGDTIKLPDAALQGMNLSESADW